MKLTFKILFLYSSIIFSQHLQFVNKFGQFSSASSFDVDLNGNFYITDIEEDAISKFDQGGNFVISIGGYGWDEAAFDDPVDITATTLSVYVADKNNNRIQRFDKDLNFLSAYSRDEEFANIDFGYPICIGISRMGDMFILDSDNYQILKFSLTGEYKHAFGSNDAGRFSLINPDYFSIDSDNNLYVLDEKFIKVFDQYGNGQYSIPLKSELSKIRLVNNSIIFISNSQIEIFNIRERKISSVYKEIPEVNDQLIVDARIISDKLIILTSSQVIIYNIIESE